jgi:hypothetical protein
MKTARIAPVRLVGLLLLCLLVPAFGFDKSTCGLFCTLQADGGQIYTVQLRVPKDSSGPCVLGMVNPTIISGPQPSANLDRSHLASFGAISHSTSTMFFPHPPPPANKEPLSPDTVRLSAMKMKDLDPLTLTNGNILRDCRLLTYQNDGVIVVRPQGVYKILFSDLDTPSRQRLDTAK